MLVQQLSVDFVFSGSALPPEFPLFSRQLFREVDFEHGDMLLAGIVDTFLLMGDWRQLFCHRRTQADFAWVVFSGF